MSLSLIEENKLLKNKNKELSKENYLLNEKLKKISYTVDNIRVNLIDFYEKQITNNN